MVTVCGMTSSLLTFMTHIDNISVLDLTLWAEKIIKLNVFLCTLKKMHTLWSIDSQEN